MRWGIAVSNGQEEFANGNVFFHPGVLQEVPENVVLAVEKRLQLGPSAVFQRCPPVVDEPLEQDVQLLHTAAAFPAAML